MLQVHKILLLFIFISGSCELPDESTLESKTDFAIYQYQRKTYNDDYILKIPKELPLKIKDINKIFKYHKPKANDLIIEKYNSSDLKNGGVHYFNRENEKSPLVLNYKFKDDLHCFYLNSVSFSTIFKNPFLYSKAEDKIIITSLKIFDNYESIYHMTVYLEIPYSDIKNIYKYAELLDKIEIFKVEN